jgi:YidC/Oxa1 family membrane protein insertase
MNNNNFNLVAAIILALGIMAGWQYFYERPKLAALTNKHQNYNKQMEKVKSDSILSTPTTEVFVERNAAVSSNGSRITIATKRINGSISLKGLRFDDITLVDYKRDISNNSPEVELLSPSNTKTAYFVETGWHNEFAGTALPDQNTVWKANSNLLEEGKTVDFTWINSDKVEFIVSVKIDQNYMFSIEQKVKNYSTKPIALRPYGIINRMYTSTEASNSILHEGPIGSIGQKLEDVTYEKIKDKKTQNFDRNRVNWLGITDKYWLTALIPDKQFEYNANFSYGVVNGQDRYQVDFLGIQQIVEPGKELSMTNLLFTGAKKVKLLDDYSKEYDITLFDRAIDFGIFYVLTKPLFHVLNFSYQYFGNFGVSILIVTVIIKLLMFGIANKSYRSMKKMKKLQPEVERIKDLYSDDKTRLHQEIMALYKREKVNPLSGCLPLVIQIPVFFSIYKVLYVTIEMRHAPFFGWIKDLSNSDPTSIFNLFGLLAFTPPQLLMIGVWPILMAITMYMQQRMSPEPADPVQASVMRFMPLMFLVMFSRFPAGLLIYWTWNNILSIVQQYYINKLDKS